MKKTKKKKSMKNIYAQWEKDKDFAVKIGISKW
jgi:hypothetical protein